MGRLRYFFFVVDVGFVLYWLVTYLHLVPASFLFKDYGNPLMVAWNWSFLPLDLGISATGFTALWRERQGRPWRSAALVSLTLTFCSGLQAVAFFALNRDFDPLWWGPNLFLLLYPLAFARPLLRATG
ncbi:MAG TPA: DUF5360 family protein [Pseudomonadota bacterium]|nr:DUF5360 family protein [Pseudomonadota bacterium]